MKKKVEKFVVSTLTVLAIATEMQWGNNILFIGRRTAFRTEFVNH